jgi:hypothetical protein
MPIMAKRRIQFSLATMFVVVIVASVLVAFGRPWLPGYQDPKVFPWRPYRPELVAELRKKQKPLLIHFVYDGDMMFHIVRRNVIETPEVREAALRHGYVPILVDLTDAISRGGSSAPVWQEVKSFGVETIIVTVVIPPHEGRPVIFDGYVSKERLVEALSGEGSR